MDYRSYRRDRFRLPGRNRPRRLPPRPPTPKRSWFPRSWAARLVAGGAGALVVATVLIVWGPFGGSGNTSSANASAHNAVASGTQAPLRTTGGATVVANATATPALSLEGAVPPPSGAAPTPSADSGRFQMPLHVKFVVTDRFGAPRANGLIHGGIDLAVDAGTPVFSACTGSVTFTGYSADTYGNYVVVDCGQGWSTLYAHFSKITIATGSAVDNSAQLGLVGSTGYSTGPHLHFEIRYQNVPVNPENYLNFHIPPGTPLSSGPINIPPPGSSTSSGSGSAANPAAATSTSTATPPPTPTATNTPRPPTPTMTPTPSPTATPTMTPTPTPTPVPRPRPTPTPPVVYYN